MLAAILLLQSLTIAVSGPPTSIEYLPLRIAEAEGYFVREGVTVTLRTTRAEPGAAEALAQGQADLAATTLESILRFGIRTTSPAPRLVFGLTAAPPVALVVAKRHADTVRSVNDLPGTRVGVTTPGAPEYTWLGWLLARNGSSVAQLMTASLGLRGVAGAVESGEVHAALVPEPYASRLARDSGARILVDLRSPAGVRKALGRLTVNAAVFGRTDRPRERDVVAVTRALLAAERRIAEVGPDVLGAHLSERAIGNHEEFAERVQTARQLYLTDGLVTAEQLQETTLMIRGHLALPPALVIPPPEQMLHLGALRRALSEPPPR
jgi:NitT/TauT family transport system substrate-binding protein